jgi:thiol-disulfide isomerase/thioredoxin
MKKQFNLLLVIVCVFMSSVSFSQTIPKWKLTDMEAAIKNAEKPTIINFWATFCKPCIEEIPYFQELTKKYDSAGVRLILVSLDIADAYPKNIQNFITKRKITGEVVFLDETNADLFCPAVDPKWSGAIPASLLINNKTGYRAFFEDQLSKEQLEKEILKMIK